MLSTLSWLTFERDVSARLCDPASPPLSRLLIYQKKNTGQREDTFAPNQLDCVFKKDRRAEKTEEHQI